MVLVTRKMILRVVLFMCFAILVTTQPLFREENFMKNDYGKSEEDCNVLQKLVELSKRVGLLKYRVHRYDVQPEEKWAKFIKKLITSGSSANLKKVDPKLVDKFFSNENLRKVPNITIFSLEFEVGGPKLFSPSSKWIWKKNTGINEDVEVELGTKKFIEAEKPVLVLKDLGINIEFILGPKFSKTQDVNAEYFDTGNPKDQKRKFSLSNPTLEMIVKPQYQKIKYRIFIHSTNVNGILADFPTLQEEKEGYAALEMIHELTNVLVDKIQDLKPHVDLGHTYGYKSVESAISLRDDNVLGFLNKWAKPTDDYSLTVNLFDAVKKFVKDPGHLGTFKSVPHNNYELEAYDKGKNIFIVDKFYDTNGFSGHKWSSKSDKILGSKLSESLNNRVIQILEKVEKEGLDERKIHKLEDWINGLMKNDFEKHRKTKLSGTKFDFHPSGRHFTYKSKVNFRPVYELSGPLFSVRHETISNQVKPPTEPEPQPEPEFDPELQVEYELEPESESQPESEYDPELQVEYEFEPESESQPEPEYDPELQVELEINTPASGEEASCEPQYYGDR